MHHVACQKDETDTVAIMQLLIDSKANVNSTDKVGDTKDRTIDMFNVSYFPNTIFCACHGMALLCLLLLLLLLLLFFFF